MTEIIARLSTALADRYTIESELGSGGMAAVLQSAHVSALNAAARRNRSIMLPPFE